MKSFLLAILLSVNLAHAQSVCYGTVANGSLTGAVQLQDGENFEVYRWREGRVRLFVHSDVEKILLEAFDELHKNLPMRDLSSVKQVFAVVVICLVTKLTKTERLLICSFQ